jgi:hypothetical protein
MERCGWYRRHSAGADFFYREWAHGGDDWLRVEARGTECSRIPARFLEEEREKKGDRLHNRFALFSNGESEPWHTHGH